MQWPNVRVCCMVDCASRSATEEIDPGDVFTLAVGLYKVVGVAFVVELLSEQAAEGEHTSRVSDSDMADVL